MAIPAENKRKQGWYRFTASSSLTLVFLHGFLSDVDCWQGVVFWPDLISADRRLNSPNIFLATYHTAASAGDYDLSQCAQEVYHSLLVPDARGNPAVMDSGEIVFVCHSMGGIVAREMLEAYSHEFARKRVGFVLMASPSMGSRFANWIGPFARPLRNRQLDLLKAGSTTLADVDRRFRRLLDERRIPDLFGAEAVEHHLLSRLPNLSRFVGNVVVTNSASRYFGEPRILPRTNHGSIVKPDGAEHVSHKFLIDFLLTKYKYRPIRSSTVDDGSAVTSARSKRLSNILFDSLDKGSIDFYYARADDEKLETALSMYSVWLVGPSGVGKTSAARAYFIRNDLAPIEICLSAYAGKLSPEHCIDEIAATVEQRTGALLGTIPRTERSITFELAKIAARSSIVLYFDEVPLSEADADGALAFFRFIARLLNAIKDESHNAELRIMLSSISPPPLPLAGSEKVLERLRLVYLDKWENRELDGLLHVLKAELSALVHGFEIESDKDVIVNAAGLPRALKSYLREQVFNIRSSGQTFSRNLLEEIVDPRASHE
ncbi:alpha/beta fold hydrolase [Paraburkholderia sp. MM5482-R1]|uniref:alpha/beta fold hydrolase n=1 Tax=unclassified Paraburkholderia TaxID=2615204 RepID=UPI003D1E42D8